MEALGAASPRADDPEVALVRRAKDGDAQAFADLYECHLDQVFRYFYYRLGHREDAEDLTEQTFLRAWQAIGSYDYRGAPFAAWIFRIAHNLLVDHRHRRSPTDGARRGAGASRPGGWPRGGGGAAPGSAGDWPERSGSSRTSSRASSR